MEIYSCLEYSRDFFTNLIKLVNSETCAAYLNTAPYLKLSPDSKNDFGFAKFVIVYKQIALLYFAIFCI